MKKRLVTAMLAAGLAASALAGPVFAKVEDERAGEPGCKGRILAVFNNDSGENPDGSPNAKNSRGPGFAYARGYLPDGVKPNDAINLFARPLRPTALHGRTRLGDPSPGVGNHTWCTFPEAQPKHHGCTSPIRAR